MFLCDRNYYRSVLEVMKRTPVQGVGIPTFSNFFNNDVMMRYRSKYYRCDQMPYYTFALTV